MRKRMPLILVLVSMAASVCFAYVAFTTGPKPTGLVVEPRLHDFGTVKPGTLTHTFRVTNHSKRRVQIERVLTGCGCAYVSLPTKEFGPGESISGRCEIDSRGRRGEFISSFKIIYKELGSNAQERVLSCKLRAVVDAVVGIEAPDLEFVLGSAETRRVRVSSTVPNVRVTAVQCDHQAFQTRLSQDGLSFVVAFDPALWKDTEGQVRITIETTCDTEKRIAIPAYVVRRRDK